MVEYKCSRFVDLYLQAIGIQGYTIKTSDDEIGFVIAVMIPKNNNERIGILKGKRGRNLTLLKQMTRVVGLSENINPYVIVKLL